MSTFWYIWFLFGLTLVQLFSTDHIQISALNVESNLNDHSSENSILGIVDDEDGLTDQICGTHPLKTILRKIAHARKFFVIFFEVFKTSRPHKYCF